MYITETDLQQHRYPELIDAVSRDDPNFVLANIGRAEREADGYLNQKYDTAELWAQTGEDRDPIVKGLVIDLTLYHIYSVAEEVPIIIRERYDYAKTALKEIRKGETLLTGVPLLADKERDPDPQILYGHRSNRY
ncbi:hypothetical protein FUAX_33100 [Fulvitalea axinellae]|uniref:DUF1320 domain-containing protein n=1 Tax=Fulvitalea axinellae TaxID=1182444 RepID=A0AAU9CRZ2_9BACT|nr:hypothetical protein FUAX_33100 [Fulvitalea axinellae]